MLKRLWRPKDRLEPTTYFAQTRDGWKIALHRYKPERRSNTRPPVLLCHGLSSNRYDMDAPHSSLAKYLCRAGYDAWVVELRGSGCSSRPTLFNRLHYDWNFDDYLYHDLPAALKLILDKTHKTDVHWVGHSMGGMLAYAYLAVWGDQSIRSVVTAGSPAFSHIDRPILDAILTLYRLARPIKRVPLRTLAHLAAVVAGPLKNTFGWFVANPRQVESWRVRQLLRLAVEDIPITLVDQFASWYHNKEFSLSYGTFNFREALQGISAPMLIIAGSRDWLTPPEDLEYVFEQLGSSDKTFFRAGKEVGFKTEYGHIDLILGKRAKEEVFPVIRDWLFDH